MGEQVFLLLISTRGNKKVVNKNIEIETRLNFISGFWV